MMGFTLRVRKAAKTIDIQIKEHKNKTGSRYTASHKAEKIVHTEKFQTRSDALKREIEIKNWKRNKKIALIKKILNKTELAV